VFLHARRAAYASWEWGGERERRGMVLHASARPENEQYVARVVVQTTVTTQQAGE